MILSNSTSPKTKYASYDDYPIYHGDDLGLTYTPQRSIFKIWAPTAQMAKINLYETGEVGLPMVVKDMQYDQDGVWKVDFEEDLKGTFYTFQICFDEEWLHDVPDPYVKAVGVNGNRGMVIDLNETNPENWAHDVRPAFKNPTDAVIYELHIRDLSSDPNSGIQNTGKFLGLMERGTKSAEGEATGLEHIKDLGITHIHLLPIYDYQSIDESVINNSDYNWGYDPQNFNALEGSYSTDPFNGAVRIREFKQLVKTLHENGIRVIMDVVYNHTYVTENSHFNQLVPGYYFRHNIDGTFSDGSGTGNETASDRAMFRKFMIESVKYWATEYHVDGFRFDLMGLHDVDTMNEISAALHKIDPTILIYGEGWTASDSPLPDSLRAIKKNVSKLNNIAIFSDEIRNGIKGHVFNYTEKGFVQGLQDWTENIKFGIVASTTHPQIKYENVKFFRASWATEPFQTITYVDCHDNHTLWDRLLLSATEFSETERIQMHKLAVTIVLTSQGISFLHAGVEFLRTKQGVENSYKSPDEINKIDWSRKSKYKEVNNYIKQLITFRKNHPAFRMLRTEDIVNNLQFLNIQERNLVGYQISNNANGDNWKNIVVIFNSNRTEKKVMIPDGEWTLVLNGQEINEQGIQIIKGGEVSVSAISAMIWVQ